MKKLTLLFVALFTFLSLGAQSSKEEMDIMQAAFGMEKKAMVMEFVKVDASQKDAFWAVYDEYETARKELGKKRIDLLNQYVANYEKLTPEYADSWTKQVIDLGKKTDALVLKYYNKVKKLTNPVVALQFYQVENYILTGIRLFVLEQLPLPDVK